MNIVKQNKKNPAFNDLAIQKGRYSNNETPFPKLLLSTRLQSSPQPQKCL